MGLTTAAVEFHSQDMIGLNVTKFDNANAAIGVGNDSTPFSQSQTQLQAEANSGSHRRKGMDSGFPKNDPSSVSNFNRNRYQATFAKSDANFSWDEWGLFNDTTVGAGVMHNREVINMGSKSNYAQWIFQIDVELVT